jgi:hypothetical protein
LAGLFVEDIEPPPAWVFFIQKSGVLYKVIYVVFNAFGGAIWIISNLRNNPVFLDNHF